MANGSFGGGDGTVGNPFLVEDAQDLNAVRDNKTLKHFRQVNHVDLSYYPNWIPISNGTPRMSSSYDGGGYEVRNLRCVQAGVQFASLFGYVENTTIKNIRLIDPYVRGGNNTGGICSYFQSPVAFENCHVINCDIEGLLNTGALSGIIDTSSIVNMNTLSSSGILKGTDRVGGLFGDAENTTIKNSFSTCDVTGVNYVGGLVGIALIGVDYLFTYASGIITGKFDVAGLIGSQSGASIKNSYALNPIINIVAGGTATRFGDIRGNLVATTITDCYSLDTMEFRQL